jgi:hypothetical protein
MGASVSSPAHLLLTWPALLEAKKLVSGQLHDQVGANASNHTCKGRIQVQRARRHLNLYEGKRFEELRPEAGSGIHL